MRTVAETSVFVRYAAEVWSETERQEFVLLSDVLGRSSDIEGARRARDGREPLVADQA